MYQPSSSSSWSSTSAASESIAGGSYSGGRATYIADEAAKKVVSVVSTGKFGYVRIERGEDGAAPNDQPASLAAGQIGGPLAKLEVQKGSGARKPLFTEEELREVSGPLAAAIGNAGPHEDITFTVSGKHSGAVSLFQGRLVTTGRAFYKSGQLNIIFGEVQGEFEDEFNATGYLRPFASGSRTAKRDLDWAVIPAEAGQYASAGRKDWIQLAEAAMAAAPAQQHATGASPAPAAPATAPAPASAAPAPHSDAYYQSIEKRLSVLKGLREKGLITEEEYNEKRKAILKEF